MSYLVGAIAAALIGGTIALADVVTLKDGRRYEGRVLEKSGASVRVDTMAAGMRVELTLPAGDIERIDEAPLPAGFFERPAPAARVSDPTLTKDARGLYLEVPVIGAFGKEVTADGIEAVLSYAKRHGVRNIVFTIDSDGGDMDEGREVYRLLREYKNSLRYHAIVKRAKGEALAVLLWCRPVLVLPGGSISGLVPKAASPEDANEEAILRSRMAERAVSDTGAQGNIAALVRALIDPGARLAAWKDEKGALTVDEEAPAGTPKERVVFQVAKGEALSLSREQCIALGMKDWKGSAADVGAVVKAPTWTAESDFGVKALARAAAEHAKRSQAKQSAHDAKVKKATGRRAEVDQHIQDAIKEAAMWDPSKESYTTYMERYNWGWTWDFASNKWTAESQRKWRTRTDACMYYLKEAGRGLHAMKKLDPEAQKLGLDPLYGPGEIDTMLKALDVRYSDLAANREKNSD